MTKQYELMVLLSADATPEQVKSIISQIEKLAVARKGKVDSSETLGKRMLAYEIKKQREAYYVLFIISLDADQAQMFNRDIILMDDVLRHLFIQYEPKAAPAAAQTESDTVEEGKE